MVQNQRTTGAGARIHEDPDQPVGAGPAPAAAAKGATAGGAVAASVIGGLVGGWAGWGSAARHKD